ncbi:MAG: LysM peptidoglycan-binding domain-containing protein [Lachnoclostridium sp.]|nr:LysM peptidoglycan-binding domain-containing protein [Lachnoclostridium sp.]
MNQLFNKKLISLAAALMALASSAQVNTLPVTKINGKIFHYYKVEPKESIYSLSHKLRMSKDEIIRHNPAAAEGLKAGQMLYFPFEMDDESEAAVPAAKSAPAPAASTHEVKRGETIFGLAKRYGISEEQLVEANPQLKSGLKAGQVLKIPSTSVVESSTEMTSSAETPAVAPEVAPSARGYVVKDKETFYSIARDNGLTVDELEAANPDITILQKGMVLTIPIKSAETVDVAAVTEPVEEVIEAVEPAEDAEADTSVDVAVILPFMLGQEPLSKQAQRFTEFYKGFMIAADSLRSSGRNINIRAFDSAASVDTLKKILADPSLKDMDAVIAPDNATQLAYLAGWGLENNVKIFNAFVVKDESFNGNPEMMQTNIPSDKMYHKAVDGLMLMLAGYTPVIVSRNEASRDKAEFLTILEQRLASQGITPVKIQFDNKLTPADLADLDPMGNYLFIPTTGRQTEVAKVLPGIISWRESKVTPSVKVFGYPEWTTFRGETLQNMHELNTAIYSRFSLDENSLRNRDFDRKFKQWYGAEMENVAPRQGLLGFDSGMYIMRMLMTESRQPSELKYYGIQNDYDFSRVPGGGWVNNSLCIINYRPGGVIEKTKL